MVSISDWHFAVVNYAHVPVKEMSVSILQIFIQNFVRKHFEIAEISSYLGENFLTPSMRFVKCRRKVKSLANHYASFLWPIQRHRDTVNDEYL